MGKLWDIVQTHIDAQIYGASQRSIAAKLGMSPTALGNWRDLKAMPTPEYLRRLADLTGTPYGRVIDAALEDAGYYPKAGEHGGDTAATTKGPDGPAASNVTSLRPDEPQTPPARVAARRRPPRKPTTPPG